MSVEIVVHRGFKNILYDNSMVGILAAIFRNKFCELDILWMDGRWKICHDFPSLSIYHSTLSDLLSLLKEYRHLVKHTIIIDIKWDFVWNRHDVLSNAILQLKKDLLGFEDYPFWIQAPSPHVLKTFVAHCGTETWKLGMIVPNVSEFTIYRKFIHYAMIALSDFSMEEIIAMSKQCLLFGYTCHNTKELSHYKHLFPYLKGIVCDVSL
jgi:glycerophosphoryl diester phosphodiesterase